MDIVKLTLTKVPELYLEAENITPDHFAGKTAQQIGELHVHLGNTTAKISDYFTVEGKGGATAADTKIIISGPTDKVKYIGMKMTAGEIEVQGNTDMYTAAWMAGGKIHVKGNVDSFCAIGMTGGEFIVDGNAKNYLAASYRGDWRGMQGGKVIVKGNAGSDTATFMNGVPSISAAMLMFTWEPMQKAVRSSSVAMQKAVSVVRWSRETSLSLVRSSG